jgi:hypothetical protein
LGRAASRAFGLPRGSAALPGRFTASLQRPRRLAETALPVAGPTRGFLSEAAKAYLCWVNGDDLSDEQLLYLVAQTDAELFRAGVDIRRRQVEVIRVLMGRLGYIGYVMAGVGKSAILTRIENTYGSIYRRQDLAIGGHIGVFMYRDIFARFSIPRGFGTVSFNPFEFVELTPVQLRIIQTEPDDLARYTDQFCDVADIEYGVNELKQPYASIELVQRFAGLTRLHLHAAAAVLTGGYDYRGAVQSALLASELALKSGAAAQGLSEAKIKKSLGHKLEALVDLISGAWPTFDAPRVRRVIACQPQYAANRYASTQPERREAGELVMSAQFLVAEVVRQLSNRDMRQNVRPPPARTYPA